MYSQLPWGFLSSSSANFDGCDLLADDNSEEELQLFGDNTINNNNNNNNMMNVGATTQYKHLSLPTSNMNKKNKEKMMKTKIEEREIENINEQKFL